MFFRSSAIPANPFDAAASSSPPRTANSNTTTTTTSLNSDYPSSSSTNTAPSSLFTTPSRASYQSSSGRGGALPPPSSSLNNESPFYQQTHHNQHQHQQHTSAGARTAVSSSSRKNNNNLHSYSTPSKAHSSPFDLLSNKNTISNRTNTTTPPPSSMATRFQHQQSLMQKFQHYPSSGNQAGSNVASSPQGAPPHPGHHNAFSPYGGGGAGPPGSPAGYPGYGLHSGPPGAVGSGPGGHLQGGPSPGIHHSGNASAGNGSGSFGPSGGQSQGGGSGSRYGAPHIGGGGNAGSGQNGPHSQMNGHHPHSQAHFHGQHLGGSNGPPGNQQIGMGSASEDRGINGQQGQGQQQQQQQTDLNNSSSAHWQQQLDYAEVSRQSTSAHHHARAAHLQQRGMTASGNVAVGDPLRHPTMSIGRPSKDGKDKDGNSHGRSDSLAADDVRPLTVTAIRKGNSTARSSDTPPQINTAAYIEAEREKTGQAWSTIDMGGMHLRNLSAELFRYTFLTTLYVPHNNLTSLPPALSTLTHLVLLDVSGNKLTSVPPELGMLTNLRELLLFDNQLTNLPSELGTLYQLDLLGIEGNPLPDNLRTLVDKEGTQGLISYLRDSCPVPLPPADREWISVDADSFPSAADADLPEPETFSVFCYNILCEKAATPQMYGYTPSWALSWDYRKELILQEILGYSADIICLQEVDGQQYEDFFLPNLSNNGYEGIYWPRTKARTMTAEEKKHVDGNATFYKPATFSLVEQQLVEFNQIAMRRPDFKKTEDMFNRVMTKDNIAVIALLEHKESGARLICANTHIYWDNEFRDVKLVQVAMLMDELTKTANHFARLPPKHPSALGKGYEKAPGYSEGNKIPMVICGDFNSMPNSGVYEYLTNGTVEKNHDDFMNHVYGSYTSEGLAHRFALKSAYSHLDNNGHAVATGEGPIVTNWTPTFKGCIDHIWHTTNSLGVTGLLGEVDPAYLSKVVGFPNAHFPSDHISILAEFKVKPQQPHNERQPEKAQFRLGGFGR